MKYNRSVFRSLTLISQFSINMLVPIFLCSFLGLYLDRKFETSYLFIILFFMGALAGFRNVYVLAVKIMNDKESSTRNDRRNRKNNRK